VLWGNRRGAGVAAAGRVPAAAAMCGLACRADGPGCFLSGCDGDFYQVLLIFIKQCQAMCAQGSPLNASKQRQAARTVCAALCGHHCLHCHQYHQHHLYQRPRGVGINSLVAP